MNYNFARYMPKALMNFSSFGIIVKLCPCIHNRSQTDIATSLYCGISNLPTVVLAAQSIGQKFPVK
jgi:hypothetical protein